MSTLEVNVDCVLQSINMYIVRFPYLQNMQKKTSTGKNKKVLLYIVVLQTKQERSSDILQGQALFIRVEQEILFIFYLQTERQKRQSDRQKKQTFRKTRQAENG